MVGLGDCADDTGLAGFVLADHLVGASARHARAAAGSSNRLYAKPVPTFSDAMALVRRGLWQHLLFSMSKCQGNHRKISERQIERLTSALSYTNG
jgi:hypothetical protein